MPQIAEHAAFDALGWWAFSLAAAMAFLEVGTPIGLVAPAEFAVPLAGAAAATGSVSLPLAIGAIWLCAAIGESLSFLVGRLLGRGFVVRHSGRLRLTPERLAWFDRHFARHGELTVIVARFGPYVRTLTPFLAGGSQLPYRRFLAASAFGTGLWTIALCVGGYLLFEYLALVRDLALGVGLALLLAAVTVAVRVAFLPRNPRPESERLW